MQRIRLSEEADIGKVIDAVMSTSLDVPMVVEIKNAPARRRSAQNALMWFWNTYSGAKLGHTKDDMHNEKKLQIGVPILQRDDPDFNDAWLVIAKNTGYLEQLELVKHMDITSKFTVKQMTEYLREYEHQAGIPLPHPEDRYYEALGYVQHGK